MKTWKALHLGALLSTSLLSADIVDFESLPLTGDFYNGADLAGGFSSAGMHFNTDFNTQFGSWSGFAYSKVSDTTTAGFMNQYATWTPGTGAEGSGQYGVVYADPSGFSTPPVLTLQEPARVGGMYINNSTYGALALLNGEGPATAFGGVSGNDPDFFRLTIRGEDSGALQTGAVDFFLADYRDANNANDYIVDDWTWVDLRSLGPDVKTLHFDLASSDNGMFGMNTPAYFTIDNVTVIPEPSSGLLVLFGAFLLIRLQRIVR